MQAGEFWWNWSVQLLAALGTVGAVLVALFGEWIRLNLLPPKLRLSLDDQDSKEIPTDSWDPTNPSAPPLKTKSRWFHVRVENDRRWIEAKDVQVLLLRVEEPNAAGQFAATWTGEVPLTWSYMPANPAPTRIVGHGQNADLVALFQRSAQNPHPLLQLQLQYIPNRLRATYDGKRGLRLVLLARERQAVSNHITVEIAWDGTWPDNAEEVPRSIVVQEVRASGATA